MTENSNGKTDSSEMNKFILNAALDAEPVFDAYRNLSEKHRNQKIDYVDFEWKYFQFYYRNLDLTIERSPLKFCDLPMDVLEKVVENLELSDCLALRKVSPELRNLVDSSKFHCEFIEIDFGNDFSSISFDRSTLSYDQADDGYCTVTLDRNSPRKTEEYLKTGNHDQLLIADASKFLKNAKLKIGSLSLSVDRIDSMAEFMDFVKPLTFPLDVRSIYVDTFGELILWLLPFLKPKRLKEIEFHAVDLTLCQLNLIAATEQWKGAERMCWSPFLEGFQMEKMMHFKTIEISGFEFNDENLTSVREILLKSTHLESCNLTSNEFSVLANHAMDEDVQQKFEKILREDPAYDRRTRRFSILNSREYFQLEFRKDYHDPCVVFNLRITKLGQNLGAHPCYIAYLMLPVNYPYLRALY